MSNKGFSSDKMTDRQKHQTLQPLGQGKFGMDSAPIKAMSPVNLISYVPEATSTEKQIDLAGHIAKIGDQILFDAGVLIGQEATVVSTTANSIILSNTQDAPITAADTFRITRPKNLAVDSDGNLVTSSGPIQYVEDAATTTVEIDTATPANNTPLPTLLHVTKDGVRHPVNKDTTTPSNTLAIPVEIVGTVGQEITITAGDINVQTSHLGANADSMRVGDGTNEMAINASLEATVHDADALVQLTSIAGEDFATETTLATRATEATLATRATEVTAAAILAKIIAAPSTEAKQDLILAKIIAAPATEAKQDAIIAKMLAAPATEAKQDDVITELQALQTAQALTTRIHDAAFSATEALDTVAYTAIANPVTIGNTITEIEVLYKNGETIGLYDGNGGSLLGYVTQGGNKIPVNIVGDNSKQLHLRAIGGNFTASDLVVNLYKKG